MGAGQRGDIGKFYCKIFGVSKSVNDGRVNPEGTEAYHEFCRQAFKGKKSNLISMTDGAPAYRCRCEACRHLFEEHHWVNHSRRPQPELSRSTPVVSNVRTKKLRDGMAQKVLLLSLAVSVKW